MRTNDDIYKELHEINELLKKQEKEKQDEEKSRNHAMWLFALFPVLASIYLLNYPINNQGLEFSFLALSYTIPMYLREIFYK